MVAPAGFGKTVAIRDFLEVDDPRHVRYDVLSEHVTLLSFVRGLADALGSVAPGARTALANAPEQLLRSPSAATELAIWLHEHLKGIEITIAVDDLHHVADGAAVGAFLGALVNLAGCRLHWIIGTRCALDLPIASWLAYGKMDLPIDDRELRFTQAEALAAAQVSPLPIGEDEVLELLRLTDGWPVAFSIALRSSTRAQDLESLAAGTREMTYAYLAEQVFQRLADEERDFLLKTCIFPVVDVHLLSDDHDAARTVASLRRNAAFFHTDSDQTFRYHELFREFLETELKKRGEHAYRAALADTACSLERAGHHAEAFRLFARAGAVDDTVRLIEQHGFDYLEHANADVVEAAIAALPEAVQENNATILAIKATFESNRGRFDTAEAWFRRAIDLTDGVTKIQLTFRYAVDLGRRERIDCIQLLEPYVDDERAPLDLRTAILSTLGAAYVLAERLSEARNAIARALELVAHSRNDELRAKINHQAAYVFFFCGESDRAKQLAQVAADLALQHDLYDLAARTYTVLYNIAYDTEDDVVRSLRYLERVRACALRSGSTQLHLLALLGMYDIEVERGNASALNELDETFSAHEVEFGKRTAETLLPGQALRAAWAGDFEYAYRLLESSADRQGGADRCALRWGEVALYAAAAGHEPGAEAAIAASDRACAECDPHAKRVLRARLYQALASGLLGRLGMAFARLGDVEPLIPVTALRLRALARAVRVFLNRLGNRRATSTGEVLAVLEQLRAQHLGGIAMLLEALPVQAHEPKPIARLTATERSILRALAKGGSSKSIAAESGRSPQTVDSHIKSICRKLECSGRREAVAFAISLGLLHEGLIPVEGPNQSLPRSG